MLYMRSGTKTWGTTERSARVLLAGIPSARRHSLARLLGRGGYTVTAVSGIGEAISNTASEIPDLVALLPDAAAQAGLEFCRKLRTSERMESVPVLLLCEQHSRTDWLSGMPGVFDVLRPPYLEDDLLVRVRLLLKLKHLSDDVEALQKQFRTAQKQGCVGALAASVAHEFNNLMCAVMGFAEMAKDGGGTDLEALRESANISYDTAKRAAATAATLLSFSRSATEQKALGNLNDAVSSAMRLLRRNMESTGIDMELDLGNIPPTQFAAGPMQQVFMNLMINAWHAMQESKDKKRLLITSRCESGTKIVVSVRDTGAGIAPEDQERIFDPFYTTKNGKDGSVIGSGLGLPLVLNVVKDHGGTVQVDSELGKGACFTIKLPVQGVSTVEDEAPAQPQTKKRSVLIVDDEEGSRRVLTRLLMKRGHDSCAVATMAEAMHSLHDRTFDLIVMDMIMPEGDGASNIRQLREAGVLAPILICTGQMDESAIDNGLRAGAGGVIRKPFSAAEFMISMNRCLA